MSNPLPNPCQPATSYPGAEFDAEIAEDEVRYPAPHVHVWQIIYPGRIICGARLTPYNFCMAVLPREQAETVLNRYAQGELS